MSTFALITDATSDLGADMVKELDIRVIPMEVAIGDRTFMHYPDGREMPMREFYEMIRQGAPATTAQINVHTYIEAFEGCLSQGLDVYYMAFSSALSGSCNNSLMAAEELRQKYPDRKIIIASTGEGLLVYLAAQERLAGKDIEQTSGRMIELRRSLEHFFTVDDLNHLKRGGRVSPTVALAGTLLGIKPVLYVSDHGTLEQYGKVRGRAKALEDMAKKVGELIYEPENQIVFLSHGDCIDDAKIVEQMINERVAPKGIVLNYIGPVVGAHSGPGTIAVFFLSKPVS